MPTDPRRVRVVVARAVFATGLIVTVVGMISSGSSGGADSAGVVVVIIGVALLLFALPFCGLNSPRPR